MNRSTLSWRKEKQLEKFLWQNYVIFTICFKVIQSGWSVRSNRGKAGLCPSWETVSWWMGLNWVLCKLEHAGSGVTLSHTVFSALGTLCTALQVLGVIWFCIYFIFPSFKTSRVRQWGKAASTKHCQESCPEPCRTESRECTAPRMDVAQVTTMTAAWAWVCTWEGASPREWASPKGKSPLLEGLGHSVGYNVLGYNSALPCSRAPLRWCPTTLLFVFLF